MTAERVSRPRLGTLFIYAWRGLSSSRLRFAVSLLGVALAVFLMSFQGSLLLGFSEAASRLIRAADAHVWVAPTGVACFEFGNPLPSHFRQQAFGVPAVRDVASIVVGFATLSTRSGNHRAVLIVGAEESVGGSFPAIAGGDSLPREAWIDRSNAVLLDIADQAEPVEINRRRATISRLLDGYGSFLGSPYVFVRHDDARRILNLDRSATSFLAVRASAAEASSVARQLQERLPQAAVRTTDQFARVAVVFWFLQTGAGGGILVAALLGFAVGLAVVTQTMYAATLESLGDLTTLSALGAPHAVLMWTAAMQASVCGAIGGAIGIAGAIPLIQLAQQHVVSWIEISSPVLAIAFVAGLVMCLFAAALPIRRIGRIDAARALEG
jgi:putative ABC transport system permease protein